MKTILVPTDFSKCANNAMMYALEVAQRTGKDCRSLCRLSEQRMDNNVYDAFWIDDYIKQRRQSMQTWAKRFATK